MATVWCHFGKPVWLSVPTVKLVWRLTVKDGKDWEKTVSVSSGPMPSTVFGIKRFSVWSERIQEVICSCFPSSNGFQCHIESNFLQDQIRRLWFTSFQGSHYTTKKLRKNKVQAQVWLLDFSSVWHSCCLKNCRHLSLVDFKSRCQIRLPTNWWSAMWCICSSTTSKSGSSSLLAASRCYVWTFQC